MKSTTLIGAATIVTLVIGILRTKVLAILLGPSGVALFGIFGSVIEIISMVSGLGIQTSGVRQVAEAVGNGDSRRISRTILVLRRVTLFLGIAGALALIVSRYPISRLTFGDTSYADDLAVLSFCILFVAISNGQMALIQGLRKIKDLATVKVVGTLLGFVVTIPIIYFLGESGIAFAMVAVAGSTLVVSWYFARFLNFEPIRLTGRETLDEFKALAGLGLTFVVSGVATVAATYYIRLLIVEQLGMDEAGYYQAALTLSGMYVGIILSAMASDFYPRLTAIAHDNDACNSLVNEQSEVALLLAGPGIVGTLTLAPLIVTLLYSAEFFPATEVLRWQILGLLGRIVSWPLGIVILAKGKGGVFAATEITAGVAHVMLVTYAMGSWGLKGTGIAFFVLYLLMGVFVRIVVGRLSCFRWSSNYLRLLILYTGAVSVTFVSPILFSSNFSLPLSCAITILTVVFSFYRLYYLLGPEFVSQKLGALPFKYILRFLHRK